MQFWVRQMCGRVSPSSRWRRKLLSPSNDGYGIGRAVWAATLAKLHVLDSSGWNTFGVRDAISGPESGMLFKRFLCCILYRQTFPEQNAGFTVASPSCVSCSFLVRPFRAVPSSHPPLVCVLFPNSFLSTLLRKTCRAVFVFLRLADFTPREALSFPPFPRKWLHLTFSSWLSKTPLCIFFFFAYFPNF